LHGLKENVIIGRKIPVGTGAEGYDASEITEEFEQEIAENIDLAI